MMRMVSMMDTVNGLHVVLHRTLLVAAGILFISPVVCRVTTLRRRIVMTHPSLSNIGDLVMIDDANGAT